MGSAGGGLLLSAANFNVLDELPESGVIGIEWSSLATLKSNLRDFQIAANSYGGAFLEILTDPAGPRILAGVENAEETQCLLAAANTYPQLEKIGAFMTLVCQRTAALLEASPTCELRASTTVSAIEVGDDGVEVTTSTARPASAQTPSSRPGASSASSAAAAGAPGNSPRLSTYCRPARHKQDGKGSVRLCSRDSFAVLPTAASAGRDQWPGPAYTHSTSSSKRLDVVGPRQAAG